MKPYKENSYLWEPLNASIKVAMVGSTVLLYPKNRVISHGVIILASLMLHAFKRPFSDPKGNIIVVAFCICDLIGIAVDSNDRFDPKSNNKLAGQIIYIVALFATLIYTFQALVRGLIPKINEMRKIQKSKVVASTYTVSFVIPDWAKPGEIMTIPNPKGSAKIRISCPQDKKPGDTMEVEAEYDADHAKKERQSQRNATTSDSDVVKMSKVEIIMLMPFVMFVMVCLLPLFVPRLLGKLLTMWLFRVIRKQKKTAKLLYESKTVNGNLKITQSKKLHKKALNNVLVILLIVCSIPMTFLLSLLPFGTPFGFNLLWGFLIWIGISMIIVGMYACSNFNVNSPVGYNLPRGKFESFAHG